MKAIGKGEIAETTRSWQLLLGFIIMRSGEARFLLPSSRKVLELHFLSSYLMKETRNLVFPRFSGSVPRPAIDLCQL